MNKEKFIYYAGQLYRNLRNTKIVFLQDDAEVLKFINGGTIPAFENGGVLQARTLKTDKITGKKCAVRRPYFICYNPILKCNILYAMTGSRTLEQIKEKKYYDSIVTPECIYDFVDSTLTDGSLDQGTHTKENISTVSLTRAIPIPNELFETIDESGMVDWNYGEFDSRQVPVLRDFMSHFYEKVDESRITKATRSGRAQNWFLDKEDFSNGQRLSRPSAIYTAMFINYALNEIENPKASDLLKLKQLKSMVEGATTAYLDYLRFLKVLESYKRRHPTVYRLYFKAKYNIADEFTTKRYEEALHDAIEDLHIQGSVAEGVKKLLAEEREIDKNLSLAVNVAISYFSGEPNRVNISDLPMNESLFKNLSKIASTSSDNKYNELLNAWNQNTNERFDKKIILVRNAIHKAKVQKEQEESRKRLEKAKQLEQITSRSERVKRAVESALKLYNEFYREPFELVLKGRLYNPETKSDVDDFVKLFTTFSDGTNLSLKAILRDSDEREAQSYLADRIMAMSEFAEVMESSKLAVEESPKVRKMQAYIKSRSNRIGGDEGEAVERAIELMTLIHEEFSKTGKFKRSNSGKTPVEAIIEKALKDKDRFSIVDFSNGSSAKAYFDEMLVVHQLQENVSNISDIFTMRVEALLAMQEIKKGYEEILNAYEKLGGAITGEFAESLKVALQKKSADEYLSEKEAEIMSLLKNGKINSSKTIEAVRELTKNELAGFMKEKRAILDFIEVFKKSSIEYSEYITKWKEDETNIAKMVLSAKTEVGFASNEGLAAEGMLVGRVGMVTEDTETGERTVDIPEENRDITDEDVVRHIFARTIPNPEEVEKRTKEQISNATDIYEVIDELSNLEKNSKAWATNLDESYDAVRKLYIEMLEYRKKFKSVSENMVKAQRLFVEGFEPRSRYDGKMLFKEDINEKIKKGLIEEFPVAREYIESYFEKYLPFQFVTQIINYFNKIETRTDISQPADDYINIRKVTERSVEDLLYVSESLRILDIVDHYDKNSRIVIDAIENAQFFDVIAMPEAREVLYTMMPMLEYDFMLETLKIASRAHLAFTAEEAEREKGRRADIIATNNILVDFSKENEGLYYQSITFYEYLIKRLPDFERFTQNCFNRIKETPEGEFVLNSGNSQVISQTVSYLNRLQEEVARGHATLNEKYCATRAFKMYHVWLTRLYRLEEFRRSRELEVITKGRDIAKEKRILSCDTTPFGVKIDIMGEDD